MSGPLTSASAAFVAKNSRIPPYVIEQSLRFDGSSYLNLTNYGQNPTDGYRGTLSIWVKNDATKYGGDAYIITATRSGSVSNLYHERNSTTGFEFVNLGVFGGENPSVRTAGKYRDYSAWYHIVVQYFNDTGANVNNGYKMWINGVQEDSVRAGGWSAQNNWAVTENSGSSTRQLGRNGSAYFGGYMAECHCIDGQNVAPTDFGEYDEFGVWRPIEYEGTYGNNGWYLKFDPSASNGVGHDHSGNGHHFTSHGFTTSGPGTDVFSDTPTTNWCTVNPLSQRQLLNTSNGNLQINYTSTGSGSNVTATQGASSGKWYWETTITSASAVDYMAAVTSDWDVMAAAATAYPGQNAYGWSYYRDGRSYHNGSFSSYGDSYTTGDVIGVALDLDNSKIYFSKNGKYQNSGNPVTGDYPAFSNVSGTVFPCWAGYYPGTIHTCNFGQREFAHPPGTASATDYFNTVTYTGTGATQEITGVGFQSDLVWIKHRNGTGNHNLFDSVRGAGKQLYPNLNDAEGDFATSGLTAFGTDGFTLGNSVSSDANINSNTYVAWCWKAGGTAVSNTDGSITSSVTANQAAGFSVVTYTGTNTAGQTFGHGLGQIPTFVIVKCTDVNNNNWGVWHKDLGSLPSQRNLYLASTVGVQNQADTTFGTFTDTTIQIGTWGFLGSTQDYVAYCWTDKAGVVKTGSYEGTSAANSIDVGFKPALVIIKNIDASSQWMMVDTERGSHQILNPNRNVAEFTSSSSIRVNLTSSGFILDGNGTDTNVSGNTYIYVAFAENFTADDSYKALNTDNLPAPDIKDGSDYFAPIVGPGDTETAWSETNTAVSVSGGQLTSYDGLSNTEYLLGRTDTKYPPIDFIRTLREIELDGHDDWYLGSQYEMEVIYYNLKPTTDNNTTVSSGQNNSYSVPQRTATNYTASDPSQTSVTAFQSGGAQALDSETSTAFVYYTSSAASTSASNGKSFTANGVAAGYNYQSGQKYSEIGITRAIRRVAYTGSEPSIGAAYGGGYYAGLYSLNGDGTATHALIVSDKSNGENTGMKALVQQKFSSGLYWIKDRQASDEHKLIDSVRGLTNQLSSNLSDGETTYSDPDNASVAWNWLAGGSGSSNTDGTITSTVSASPSSGFSIGTFTGTGAVGSIGHGLGVAPKFILIKRTNVNGNSWAVYHDSVGAGKQLLLNSQNAVSNDTNGFPSAPTSSVINVGTGAQMDTNQVGAHVFFAWSEVEGYSKIGSYNGNANADGPFIYTGFKVAWLMVKKNAGSTDWKIYDAAREPYNIVANRIAANTSNAELDGNAQDIDFLSNGFKFRGTNGDQNSSGTFYYVAFASHPFGGDGVNPATAR